MLQKVGDFIVLLFIGIKVLLIVAAVLAVVGPILFLIVVVILGGIFNIFS